MSNRNIDCGFDCFNCHFSDCTNSSPKIAKWESEFIKASGLPTSNRKKGQAKKEKRFEEKRDVDIALARKLKAARLEKHFTQTELAEKVCLPSLRICLYETCRKGFDPSIFNGILW